ncbi:MAG: 50S ribosomal protein L19 [Bdellovibrionaceae bacterium]|nr:50S ribosomal protein L19 [Pseudobdellovibrionaceae bacterium]MEC9281996.1 50S ribosomal protein L19 [Bdellovibrionota bacterium]|tara:strand:+ start:20372 stop:20746 length:375 start_codon:yes stop_codon:yes gene_type:complete
MDIVKKVTAGRHSFNEVPEFGTGDTVEVHVKVKEGEKERIQKFKGTVIKTQGTGTAHSFTVRKMASGVGVERTFPFASPNVAQVDLLARGKIRQSRLYYLRELRGKKARITSELVTPASSKKSK